jgi:4-carboxymuconolactone decarboxylase
MRDRKAHEAGLALRRTMFGPAGADEMIAKAGPLKERFEEIVTEFCFGDIWHRPPLDHRTRSMLTVAILAALGRSPQLRNHLRGAINNGVSVEELREVLIHTALYAGIPAAAEGFSVARAVFQEMGLE